MVHALSYVFIYFFKLLSFWLNCQFLSDMVSTLSGVK